jgi:polyisoprenoid-binding protein YceI
MRLMNKRLAIAIVLLIGLAGVAVGGYGIWYLFLSPPGPAAVTSPAPIATTPGSSPNAGPAGSTDGTWNVDTTVGSFSDFSDSWVGYRVQEQLVSIGANIAVGRTPGVSGNLVLQGSTLQSATVTADLSTLRSDDQRRDGQLERQGIETATFPTATFSLSQPTELSSVPADGSTVTVQTTGDLTLHGVTKSVQLTLTVARQGDVVGVAGSTEILFADYNISPPNSFLVLSIADTGTMEFQIYFRHA